ncbi:unnamed protein product [Thlaspi arvense]|uniref:Pentatricopeptide repeat-containing protein n=1 Tax=Thlaspi arvense TaxID=13288 RepID=A0AAU9T6E4_THLAR|nr:unnamed protein product [Thlaspi arvense]
MIQRSSSLLSSPSIETLLKLCKSEIQLHQIHARIIRKGLEQDQNLVSIFLSSSPSRSYSSSVFERVRHPCTYLWNCFIKGYSNRFLFFETVSLLVRMMRQGLARPDDHTFPMIMKVCANNGQVRVGSTVHGLIDSYLQERMKKYSSHYVVPALINMNAKCGHMDRAAALFEEMPRRDLVSYCSMMEGMAIHGCGGEAVQLFERMLEEGIVPDKVAFIVILKVCGQAGLVEDGLRYFELMQRKYSIVVSPDHYSCIVSLLSRSGKLKEAYELIKSMPVEAHASAWGSLLGGCSVHGDTKIAEAVARRLFELEPQSGSNYVLLSNIYAALDRWGDVAHLRDRMKENGIKKISGRSWISRYNLLVLCFEGLEDNNQESRMRHERNKDHK